MKTSYQMNNDWPRPKMIRFENILISYEASAKGLVRQEIFLSFQHPRRVILPQDGQAIETFPVPIACTITRPVPS
jgi:hypothetical protein